MIEFAINIWWWPLGCKEEWTATSTAKFGRSVNMRSMQDNELCHWWVGSDISCCSQYIIVTESMSVSSGGIMSSDHHDLDVTPSLMANLVQETHKYVILW